MRVYVTTQGASIVKEGGHLLVRCGKDIHHTVFVHKMNQLILCGNITLTPPARNVLFKINIMFLQQTMEIGKLCHHTDRTDDGKRRGHNMLRHAGHHVAPAGSHLVYRNCQTNPPVANTLQL